MPRRRTFAVHTAVESAKVVVDDAAIGLWSMTPDCAHLDRAASVEPSSTGCEDCLRMGGQWVHLRMCMTCGHVGCCDNSPNRHATSHFRSTEHPLIQSYEPGEDWWFCYVDELAFMVDGAASFEHP